MHILSLRARRQAARPILVLSILLSSSVALADNNDSHAHEHRHEDHGVAETIVVTGTPLEHDRDEVAIPVDVVDRSELLEHLGSTLGETLAGVPGIATTGFAGGASRPVIRGQDAYRTEVLEDGLGTQDVSRESPDHAVPFNPLAARRIEIIRGPAILRYGGGASAGVVNAITNRIPDRLPQEEISGEVFAGIGTVANERDLAASLDARVGSFAFHGDGLLRTSNDYSIPNDNRPRVQSGTDTESFSGSIGWAYFHDDSARIGFAYTRVENDYGIPEAGESVEIDMQTDRFRFEGDLHAPLEGIRQIRVRGVYSDYEHDELADGDVGQTYRNKEFEGRLEIVHEPVMGFLGAVGIQGKTRDFRAKGEAAEFLAPTDTTMGALYLYEEREILDDLTGEIGFRLEVNEVDGRDANDRRRDRTFTPLSGSIGLVSFPTDWLSVGATGAVGQRAPSQVELLARGAHEATSTFEIGDPKLDEETSYSGELRAKVTIDRLRFEWAGFATRYDDFIYGELTGLTVDEDGNSVAPTDPDALDQLLYTERNAVFYGTEASGELDLLYFEPGTIGIDGRFDFVRARFTAGHDRDVPRIVPIRWGGGLFWDSDSLVARVGFLRTEPQSNTGAFETSTKSFTFLNASIVYRRSFLDDLVPVEISVVGRNLNDVRGRNHVSFNKDDVLLPGRSVRFGLRVSF